MSTDLAQVTLGSCAGGLFIGVNGRATQRVCPTLDRLVSDYLATCTGTPQLVLDLTGCPWVDSTFAGWMIGVQTRLGAKGGALLLTGCAERCRASLDKLRLGEHFAFGETVAPEHMRTITCEVSARPEKATLQLMADAHEQLAAIDGPNRDVFRPIAEMLKRQLQQAK